MRHYIVVFVAVGLMFVSSPFLSAQANGSKGHPIKISTITDNTNQSSADMMSALRKKISSHPNLFVMVSNSDDSPGLVLIADCIPRDTPNDAYVCSYTSHYSGGVVKTFFGGGVYTGKSADEAADKLLASMAQDLVERWNSTMRSNAIEMLESCLFLTQSSCAVPETLTPELHSKVLNLSQYLQKGGLKK